MTDEENVSLPSFHKIYLVDLGGDVQKNPKLSGTTHNVFGIKLRVVIVILVKRADKTVTQEAKIFYVNRRRPGERSRSSFSLMPQATLPWSAGKSYNPTQIDNWLTRACAMSIRHCSCYLGTLSSEKDF